MGQFGEPVNVHAYSLSWPTGRLIELTHNVLMYSFAFPALTNQNDNHEKGILGATAGQGQMQTV